MRRIKNEVIQNLKDAGCSDEMIKTFVAEQRQDNVLGQKKILREQRVRLLDKLHEGQDQLFCLDYLLHNIEKTS